MSNFFEANNGLFTKPTFGTVLWKRGVTQKKKKKTQVFCCEQIIYLHVCTCMYLNTKCVYNTCANAPTHAYTSKNFTKVYNWTEYQSGYYTNPSGPKWKIIAVLFEGRSPEDCHRAVVKQS